MRPTSGGGAPRLLTDEQHEVMLAIVPGHGHKEIQRLLEEKTGVHLTIKQVRGYIGNHHLKSGVTGHFKKGVVPWNTGTKGVMKANKTSFKPGLIPPKHRPVGSTRLSKGYEYIKVAEHQPWRRTHVYLWEQANGPLPKGSVVVFADGDRTHIALDNLIVMTKRDVVKLNKLGWIRDQAPITRTLFNVLKLQDAVKVRKKEEK
jgi:hypothetical protein